jgi:hypothetical protein
MSSLSARHTMTMRREQAQGTQAFRPCTIRRAPQEDQTATPSSWAMCRPNIWGEWNITAEETRIRACKASWLDTR